MFSGLWRDFGQLCLHQVPHITRPEVIGRDVEDGHGPDDHAGPAGGVERYSSLLGELHEADLVLVRDERRDEAQRAEKPLAIGPVDFPLADREGLGPRDLSGGDAVASPAFVGEGAVGFRLRRLHPSVVRRAPGRGDALSGGRDSADTLQIQFFHCIALLSKGVFHRLFRPRSAVGVFVRHTFLKPVRLSQSGYAQPV